MPLKVVLEDLHDNKKRIIYKNIEPGILNKRISVVFDAIDVDVPATKSLLINNICNAYSLRAIKQEIDTSVWTVSIADHAKLKSFATVMTNKNEGYANGRGGGWSREDKTFTYVGYSLAEFIQILEKECNVICEYEKEDKDTMNYDFIEVDATDFESIRKELTGKYGLKFTLLRKKLTFLVVEKI